MQKVCSGFAVSLSAKQGTTYRDTPILISNHLFSFEVHVGDRIAQIVFLPYAHMQFEPVNELDSTERGEKGFGSSGIN